MTDCQERLSESAREEFEAVRDIDASNGGDKVPFHFFTPVMVGTKVSDVSGRRVSELEGIRRKDSVNVLARRVPGSVRVLALLCSFGYFGSKVSK